MKKLITKDVFTLFGLAVSVTASSLALAENILVQPVLYNGVGFAYELNSKELAQLVGGVAPFTIPRVKVDVNDYSVEDRDSGQVATAVFVNQTDEQVNYTFEVISIDGSVLEVLESGVVAAGETLTSNVAPTVSFKGLGKGLRGRIWNENLLGVESQDYSLPR